MRPLPTPEIEGEVGAALREITRAVRELQQLPAAAGRVLRDVALADGVETPVAHGLARAPTMIKSSIPRGPTGAGYIEEVRTANLDRTKFVVLKATGYVTTITVDLEVA